MSGSGQRAGRCVSKGRCSGYSLHKMGRPAAGTPRAQHLEQCRYASSVVHARIVTIPVFNLLVSRRRAEVLHACAHLLMSCLLLAGAAPWDSRGAGAAAPWPAADQWRTLAAQEGAAGPALAPARGEGLQSRCQRLACRHAFKCTAASLAVQMLTHLIFCQYISSNEVRGLCMNTQWLSSTRDHLPRPADRIKPCFCTCNLPFHNHERAQVECRRARLCQPTPRGRSRYPTGTDA